MFKLLRKPSIQVAKVQADGVAKAAPVRRVLVVSSFSRSLVNFRFELMKAMVAAGHEVVALGPEQDDDVCHQLREAGIAFRRLPMARASLSPFHDLMTFFRLLTMILELRPSVVVAYTMKPIIYAGIAARLMRVPSRSFLFTGLGHIYSQASLSTTRGRFLRWLSARLYRVATTGARAVFVYNDADERDVTEGRLVKDLSRLHMVAGSGVDIDRYAFVEPETSPPVFLMVCRLLKDKGVLDYVAAARLLKQDMPEAVVQLLGPFDPNPSAISKEQIRSWIDEGVIDYLGETADVRPYLARCNVFVLPSYYREGIPRSILEAMAVGRAIITCDTPGCRDTVVPGANGYLVPPQNSRELFAAMSDLARQPAAIREMGLSSRSLACQRFDVREVNRFLMHHMGLAIGAGPQSSHSPAGRDARPAFAWRAAPWKG